MAGAGSGSGSGSGPRLLLLGCALAAGSAAFNLDAERPAVYSGAQGSYFGFAVDFFAPDSSS